MRGPLLAQSLGDFQSVDAVDPIEMLGHQTGLVALNRADAMPDQTCGGGLGAQLPNLVDAFLDVVFAEIHLPASRHGADGFHPESLGDSQQTHR